eukprot:SAG31_NODE_21285_length_553_cov_0.995595_1_plen_142_part_10
MVFCVVRSVDPRKACRNHRLGGCQLHVELHHAPMDGATNSGIDRLSKLPASGEPVRVVTFSFLCPLLEKYGTFIARCNALIEKVSSFSDLTRPENGCTTDGNGSPVTGYRVWMSSDGGASFVSLVYPTPDSPSTGYTATNLA